ncbi:aldo/keto reductase [Sorangium sp. So ce1097]|uniref:aldo/keto reductase n=1 Tax=Sorangium sp. So ce1097 TaxID=3133330 RepID=UPI003F5F3BCB
MEKRRIGSLAVSVVGIGCNNFGGRIDEQRTAAVVDAALDAGINFFDTADVYGGTRSEELLGRALGGRRSRVIIATKFGIPLDDERKGGAKPAYIQRAVEDSLRRLGTDWIDLYQIHRPDPETPIGDTLEALDALVRAGKVREIGSSNFSASQLRGAAEAARPGAARFVSVQNEYSLLQREPEREELATSERLGLAFLPYFPLASGLLSGKYLPDRPAPAGARLSAPDAPLTARFLTDQNRSAAAALAAFASSRGHTLLELAFSWLAARPAVASVIAGATSPEQVRANAAAVGWRLTASELREIDRLAPPPAG